MEIFYGKPTSNTFFDILDQYSEKEINSIKTSTIPLLNYWKNTEERVLSFLNEIAVPSAPLILNFEYPTRSHGSNKASMSDIMVFGDNWKAAIEAKYTEIKYVYETVKNWNKDKSQNRSNVVDHWLHILQPFLTKPLIEEEISEIPYQFLHRVASSCEGNTEFAWTVYQVFYDQDTESKLGNFKNLLSSSVRYLNPKSNLKIFLHIVKTELLMPNAEVNGILGRLKENDIYAFGEEQFEQLLP
jgi:hypothetical protein